MQYTLICSAAGTGLTNAVAKLVNRSAESSGSVTLRDVESILCTNPEVWQLPQLRAVEPSRRDMAAICSKLPRSTVAHHWRIALRTALGELSTTPALGARVLACHLTLFSPTRSETYVPSIPDGFLSGEDTRHEVKRLVVLIDDIYDMYARLCTDTGMLNEEQQKKNYAEHVLGLSGTDLLNGTDAKPNLLDFEVRLRSLEFLIAWRRSELIYAQALAQAFGDIPVSILSVKHQISSLELLISGEEVISVYLSHKISEPRRQNRAHPGTWIPLVSEINNLSPAYARQGVVLLHPTGIDELRMSTWDQRVALGDRWPLQDDAGEVLLYEPDGRFDPPEHLTLFDHSAIASENATREAIAQFRAFEMTVFMEIAARDHMMVSTCQGLLLYRPVMGDGKDSSGARAEVKHWEERWRARPVVGSLPRLVSLHTLDDIDARIGLLTPAERAEFRGRVVYALEDQGFDRQAANELVDGTAPVSRHLHQLSGAENLPREVEFAINEALQPSFLNWLSNVRAEGTREGASIVFLSTPELPQTSDVCHLVARLLRSEEDAVSTTAQSIASYLRSRGFEDATTFARTRLLSEPLPA